MFEAVGYFLDHLIIIPAKQLLDLHPISFGLLFAISLGALFHIAADSMGYFDKAEEVNYEIKD